MANMSTTKVPRKAKRERKHAGSDSSFESIKSLHEETILNDFDTIIKSVKKGKKKKKKRLIKLNTSHDSIELKGTIDPETSKRVVTNFASTLDAKKGTDSKER